MSLFFQWIDRLDKAAAEGYFLHVYNPSIEGIAAVFSNEYLHLIWFVPVAVWIFYKYPKQEAAFWLAGLLAAFIFASFLVDIGKEWAGRPRPVTWLGIALEMPPTSWPSAHSGNSYAIATVTFLFARVPGFIAFFFAAGAALSRFFLLKHYPSDILSGAVIGIAAAFIAYAAVRRLQTIISEYSSGDES